MKYSAVLAATVLFLVLIVANLSAGKWFFTQGMPKARITLESRLGLNIESGLTSVWQIAKDSSSDTSKQTRWHALLVPACQFVLMMGFLVFVVGQIVVIFLVARMAKSGV